MNKHPVALHSAWEGQGKPRVVRIVRGRGLASQKGMWQGMGSPGPQDAGQNGQVEVQISHIDSVIHPVCWEPSHSP